MQLIRGVIQTQAPSRGSTHMIPDRLDWGRVTPEFANTDKRIAVHVFNHSLESAEAVDRTIRFVQGRLAWHALQIPDGFTQWVSFDDRGQSLLSGWRDRIRDGLAEQASRVHFTSDGRLAL